MTDTIPCPIEGCDYAAESKRSVRGHVMGKSDESHRGYTWTEIGEMLGVESAESGVESDPPTNAPQFPEAPQSDESGGCPDCGSADHMTTAEAKERLPGEPEPVLDEYERVCVECGELYDG